jgi:uncharacterized protein with beta-barrel porin domain
MSFKVRLLLGAAVPFVFCLPAAAQVTISTATTTPVTTSTANSGAASDVTIASGGSIALTSQPNTAAVTVDSNNKIVNNGAISSSNSDGATGVLILPNLTTGYTGAGSIAITEDYTRTDTNNDGNPDGPLAQGTGRAGILVQPGGTMTGDITMLGGSSISVKGNNSYGVSVQSALDGDFSQKGSVVVTGSNDTAVDLRQNVSGNVYIGGAANSGDNATSAGVGSVAANGENSIGVNVAGDVAGEFRIDGAVTATGFTSTTLSNYLTPPQIAAGYIAPIRNADDLLVGGPAVAVRGNLAKGLLIQGAAVGDVDPTDDVKDVVQDFNVNRATSTISSIGSAPALLIAPEDGASGRSITFGLVHESVADTLDDDKDSDLDEIIGQFDYNYGLMNRGTISANGFNKGFAANAVRIAGSADGTHTTTIDGGIFNGGSISATSFDADATGLSIGSGASTPQLVNSGSITASVSSRLNVVGTAVQIDAGAAVPAVINSGSIVSNHTGYDGDAVAFRDLSGTVTSFTNNSRISAGFTDDDTTDTVTSGAGKAIAIDLSHATSNITLTQNDTIDNARILGNVLLGAGSDRFDLLSGSAFGDVDFGAAGADTLNINSAALTGAATFSGSGAVVSLDNSATMVGNLSLGGANSTLTLNGGSSYDGAITRAASGGSLAIAVNNSTMNNRAAGTLNVDSLSVANGSNIGFVINNARAASGLPIFNVLGAANISGDTVFTPIFEDFTNQTFTLQVLNAGTLNLGGSAANMLNAQRPFIYDVSLEQNGNALDLTMRVKTAAELGLNRRSTGAYSSVLELLAADPAVGGAFTGITAGNVFDRAFSDLLPAQDAAVSQVLATNANAAFGATARRLDLVTDRPSSPGGAWLEEFGVYHDGKADADTLGVTGGGYGIAGGLDLIHSGNSVLGAYVALDSIKLEENGRTSAPLAVTDTSFGGYGGWKAGRFAINATAAAGFLKFDSTRSIVVGSLTDSTHAAWHAHSFNGAARATYTIPMGFLQLKPYLSADYLGLWQDGYKESAAATTATGLALTASSAESHLATASIGTSLAAEFGSDDTLRIRPELSVGYRGVLDWTDKSARLQFAGGGSPFSLSPGHDPQSAVTAGLGVNINSEFLNIKIGYDGEFASKYTTHYGSITLRLAFW